MIGSFVLFNQIELKLNDGSIGKNCPNAMITRIIRSDFVDFTYTSSAIALLESVTEERARMLTNTGKSA
jgi:hypothetical protein